MNLLFRTNGLSMYLNDHMDDFDWKKIFVSAAVERKRYFCLQRATKRIPITNLDVFVSQVLSVLFNQRVKLSKLTSLLPGESLAKNYVLKRKDANRYVFFLREKSGNQTRFSIIKKKSKNEMTKYLIRQEYLIAFTPESLSVLMKKLEIRRVLKLMVKYLYQRNLQTS